MAECIQHGGWYLSETVLSTTNNVSDGIPLRVTIRCGWCKEPVVFDRSDLVPHNGGSPGVVSDPPLRGGGR